MLCLYIYNFIVTPSGSIGIASQRMQRGGCWNSWAFCVALHPIWSCIIHLRFRCVLLCSKMLRGRCFLLKLACGTAHGWHRALVYLNEYFIQLRDAKSLPLWFCVHTSVAMCRLCMLLCNVLYYNVVFTEYNERSKHVTNSSPLTVPNGTLMWNLKFCYLTLSPQCNYHLLRNCEWRHSTPSSLSLVDDIVIVWSV